MENLDIKISIMELSDLESIAPILETDFDDFWNYNVFKSELENGNSKYIVAKIDKKIAREFYLKYTDTIDKKIIRNLKKISRKIRGN